MKVQIPAVFAVSVVPFHAQPVAPPSATAMVIPDAPVPLPPPVVTVTAWVNGPTPVLEAVLSEIVTAA